jgi:hypothetical protein
MARSYDELVAEGRKLIDQDTDIKWRLGELALELVPITPERKSWDEEAENRATLERFANDLGISFSRLREYRAVADKWPAEKRNPAYSFYIHTLLAFQSDRFKLIKRKKRWTQTEVAVLIDKRTAEKKAAKTKEDTSADDSTEAEDDEEEDDTDAAEDGEEGPAADDDDDEEEEEQFEDDTDSETADLTDHFHAMLSNGGKFSKEGDAVAEGHEEGYEPKEEMEEKYWGAMLRTCSKVIDTACNRHFCTSPQLARSAARRTPPAYPPACRHSFSLWEQANLLVAPGPVSRAKEEDPTGAGSSWGRARARKLAGWRSSWRRSRRSGAAGRVRERPPRDARRSRRGARTGERREAPSPPRSP